MFDFRKASTDNSKASNYSFFLEREKKKNKTKKQILSLMRPQNLVDLPGNREMHFLFMESILAN